MSHNESHPAIDDLMNLFVKANRDLNVVQQKLEKEFQQIYPDNANPMKIVSRIKNLQEELVLLNERCRELLAAKQDFIEKTRTLLVANRNSIQGMQASMGIPSTSDTEDPAFANFNQLVSEVFAPFASKQPRLNQCEALLISKLPCIDLFYGSVYFADKAYKIIDEWTAQIRSRTGDENQDSESEDVNKLLFSAIV